MARTITVIATWTIASAETGPIVVVENLDEHEDERGEQRRSQEREDDAPARLPPAGARGSPRPIELFADPRERRVHDDVREGQVAYAEGEHDPPDAPAEPVTDRTRDEKGPEEADPDDDPRGGARIEKDDREAPPEREARAMRDERRERDERRRKDGADDRDDRAVLQGPAKDVVAERLPVTPGEELPRGDQRRQHGHDGHQGEP